MKKPLRSPLHLGDPPTSGGETRRFGPGDVLRVDEVAPGNGHISAVGGAPAERMIVR
jgi:hypothetical protein